MELCPNVIPGAQLNLPGFGEEHLRIREPINLRCLRRFMQSEYVTVRSAMPQNQSALGAHAEVGGNDIHPDTDRAIRRVCFNFNQIKGRGSQRECALPFQLALHNAEGISISS